MVAVTNVAELLSLSDAENDESLDKLPRYVTREGIEPSSENPWKDETKAETVVGNRTVSVSHETWVNPDTNDVLTSAKLHTRRRVRKGMHVQIFPMGLAAALNLRAGPRRVLDSLMYAYGNEKHQWGDRVYFNHNVAISDCHYSGKRAAFNNGLNQLIHAGFIWPVKDKPDWYHVRPLYFYKGDIVKLVDEYIKEK